MFATEKKGEKRKKKKKKETMLVEKNITLNIKKNSDACFVKS